MTCRIERPRPRLERPRSQTSEKLSLSIACESPRSGAACLQFWVPLVLEALRIACDSSHSGALLVPGLPSGRRVFRFLVRAGGSDFRQNCTSQPILEINWVTLEVDFEIPEVQGGVALEPRRSREVRGSPELKNGGLRAPEDAWMMTS